MKRLLEALNQRLDLRIALAATLAGPLAAGWLLRQAGRLNGETTANRRIGALLLMAALYTLLARLLLFPTGWFDSLGVVLMLGFGIVAGLYARRLFSAAQLLPATQDPWQLLTVCAIASGINAIGLMLCSAAIYYVDMALLKLR